MTKFIPSPGEVATVQTDASHFQVYLTTEATNLQEQSFFVHNCKKSIRYEFLPVSAPVLGGKKKPSFVTLQTSIPLSGAPLHLDYIIRQNGNERHGGSISVYHETKEPKLEVPFKTSISLSESAFQSSIRLPWLEIENWEGWLWVRSR